jgi:hypothetical protein
MTLLNLGNEFQIDPLPDVSNGSAAKKIVIREVATRHR